MKLSAARMHELEQLLKELDLAYDDQELRRVGLAIMRFVLQKELRKQAIANKEKL